MKNRLNKNIAKSVNQYADEHNEKTSPRNRIEDEICNDLIQPTKDYNPEPLFNKINDFVNEENNFNRILFSEIYSFIYTLDDNSNSTFITNLNRLFDYSKKTFDKKYDDTKKIIVKLYDHIHIVILQDEQVKKIFTDNIDRAKNDLDTKVVKISNDIDTKVNDIDIKLNSSEKNYITILGIFSSFVVSFVGGGVFSSSVLSNIEKPSIYRLILVILLLGFVLISICFSLYWFIAKIINKCDTSKLHNIYRNIIITILAFLFVLFISWKFGFMDRNNRVCERIKDDSQNEKATDITYDKYNNSTNSDVN